MRVAIVGAGALGSVYGARLARVGCEVDVVARAPRPPAELRFERVSDGEAIEWRCPAALSVVPAAAEVVLVAVRYPDLANLAASLPSGPAPVVVLTPMLPADHARLSAALAGRVVAAMPSVVAYRKDPHLVRYWLPRGVSTFVGVRSPAGAEAKLPDWLSRAGITAKSDPDVLSRNVATTVSFMPLAMGIDAAGGLDAALRDRSLLTLVLDATQEGRTLGRQVGKVDAWASMLLKFVSPLTLKAAATLARARAPEAFEYAETHFGRKLHSQNVALGEGIVRLAQERGSPHRALQRLLDHLRAAEHR